jgi:hypothetical protein
MAIVMQFLFPSDYFNVKKPDEGFVDQVSCFRSAGFQTSVISLENLGTAASKVIPPLATDEPIVYRGWMLSAADYGTLATTVEQAGGSMLISQDQYLSTHYLPNWYGAIEDLTPETRIFSIEDDLEKELQGLGWDGFFIKDYVKSLKTSIGSRIDDAAAIGGVIAEMEKFRGQIEGGICVRRIEDFKIETEQRYFVLHGKAFAVDPDAKIPEIVQECANRISSPFFSVDAIDRSDGVQRIVEIGDGQVSDLVGWTAERFVELWR